MGIDKGALRDQLLTRLEAELERAKASQKNAQDGATHEENRAESDKDMRATEAAYLARGQAQRVESLTRDVDLVRAMAIAEAPQVVSIGTVVELESESGKAQRLFVAPAGGGEKLALGSSTYNVVTPSSPLGAAVVGLHLEDDAEVRGPAPAIWSVIAIH